MWLPIKSQYKTEKDNAYCICEQYACAFWLHNFAFASFCNDHAIMMVAVLYDISSERFLI